MTSFVTDAAPFTRSIAVVVGINAYQHGLPPLETAVNDATRVARTLADDHGYEVVRLVDEEAALSRLTSLLTKELPAMVGPDDRVLFYFAGHGVALDGDTGPNGYLLPADARRGEESSFLHMPLVHDALLALPCRHLLVVLDACFSGAFRWSSTRDIGRDVDVVHREKYDRYLREPAWQVLTSASGDQKALDQLTAGSLGSRPGQDGHSPFALALFDALAGKGDLVPAGAGDGLLLATELFLYIDEQLRTAAEGAGHAQAPQLWPLRKHGRGEFLGRWLLTARDDDGALDLWPLDEERLLRELRTTRACLAPTERQRYLAEDATTAATRAEACRQGPAR